MQIKVILLFCFFVSCFSGHSQNNCADFKNGTFKFIDKGSQRTCILTRDGDRQTERMEDSEEVYDFTIKWVDSCTYTVSPTIETVRRKKEISDLGTMTVKISPVSDSSYIHLVRVAKSPKFKRRDEVFVVKD